MENPIKSIKMDDLGGKPTIFGNIHIEEIFVYVLFISRKVPIRHDKTQLSLTPPQFYQLFGWSDSTTRGDLNLG